MIDGRVQDHTGVFLVIEDSESGEEFNFGPYVTKIRWTAFINNGYTMVARMDDVNARSMSKLMEIGILRKARKDRFVVRFAMGWHKGWHNSPHAKQHWTDDRIGILSRIDAPRVDRQKSVVEIEVIDPASWYLNRGDAEGTAWKGKIGGTDGVISQIIKTYATKGSEKSPNSPVEKVDVSDTIDNDQNIWYMMRLDPKTFILTLMEWSSQLTVDQTPWIVQSQDDFINIKEMSKLKPPKDHNGDEFVNRPIEVNTDHLGRSEVVTNGITVLNNSLLTIMQTRLFTAGISSVTGKYVDEKTDRDSVQTYDVNTSKKWNVDIENDRGFAKPAEDDDWSTFIKSTPEHNNGDVGVLYWNYISGRPRDYFMKLLYTVMRLKVKIYGDPNFDRVDIFGPSSVFLKMSSLDSEKTGEPFYLSGPWMVYGFDHILSEKKWETNLYLSRLDYDSLSKNASGETIGRDYTGEQVEGRLNEFFGS